LTTERTIPRRKNVPRKLPWYAPNPRGWPKKGEVGGW